LSARHTDKPWLKWGSDTPLQCCGKLLRWFRSPSELPSWTIPSWPFCGGGCFGRLSVYDKDVALLRQGLPQAHAVPMGLACGPAVLWGFVAVANLFIFWLLVPIGAYFLSSCAADGNGFAVVGNPPPLIGLFFVVVTLPVHISVQLKCMSHVILPQLEITKRFDFLFINLNKFRYEIFLILFCCFAAGCLSDSMTNGIVMGRVMKSADCPGSEAIENHWRTTMNGSVLMKLPFFKGARFTSVALFAYALQLTGPLFALAYSVPLQFWTVDYKVGMNCGEDKNGVVYSNGQRQMLQRSLKTEYCTLFNHDKATKTNHGAVLQVMASLARMEAITFQDAKFATVKMGIAHEKICKGLTTPVDDETKNTARNYYKLARVELERGLARFGIIGLIQNVFQLSLQVSFLGIQYRLTDSLDINILTSVILLLVTGIIPDFPDMVDIVKIVHSVKPIPNAESFGGRVQRARRKVVCQLCIFILMMVAYLLLLVWCICKLVAVFVCPDHLWDVSLNFYEGCTG